MGSSPSHIEGRTRVYKLPLGTVYHNRIPCRLCGAPLVLENWDEGYNQWECSSRGCSYSMQEVRAIPAVVHVVLRPQPKEIIVRR